MISRYSLDAQHGEPSQDIANVGCSNNEQKKIQVKDTNRKMDFHVILRPILHQDGREKE